MGQKLVLVFAALFVMLAAMSVDAFHSRYFDDEYDDGGWRVMRLEACGSINACRYPSYWRGGGGYGRSFYDMPVYGSYGGGGGGYHAPRSFYGKK